ncbi:hypothetical protein BH10PSE7_BH10PSE7_03660 [soil metagenome]
MIIEAPAGAADGAGGWAPAWSEVATVWGAIEALPGREVTAGDATAGEARFRITIRHRGDVTAAHRLREGTRVFDITSVADPGGRRRYLDCLCTERTSP